MVRGRKAFFLERWSIMKAAFIGGGSLRLLPIFRAIFAESPEVFRNGEIRLIDRVVERAQAVKDLLLASPEYPAVACRVVVSSLLLPDTMLRTAYRHFA